MRNNLAQLPNTTQYIQIIPYTEHKKQKEKLGDRTRFLFFVWKETDPYLWYEMEGMQMDLIDKMCAEKFVTKEEWKQICRKEGKWCEYKEVSEMNRLQAEEYIRTMPTLEPM